MENEDLLETGKNKDSIEVPQEIPGAASSTPESATAVTRELILPIGTSRLHLVIDLPGSTHLAMEVEIRASDGRLIGRQGWVLGGEAEITIPLRQRVATWVRAQATALPVWLFWLALGVYTFTRLYALPTWPIYFFTDEAIQTVTAADLLRSHFFSPTHEFLPTYFENGSQYNLSASVYLQILPYVFFGKSIWVTRGAAALLSLVAPASVGLILKHIFKKPYPWLAVMFLSITPAWFLHSRTAFETALATSFYAGFLFCYLMYRTQSPRYLYGAVGLGALAFYSYSGLRMVLLVTCLLLFLSDLKYHLRNIRIVLGGLGLTALFLLPFLRFLINHPDASSWQMRMLGSYWILDIPLREKLADFAVEYLRGLDPMYWYLPNSEDLLRHVMLGYGHVLIQTFALGFFGIVIALRHIRQPAYRAILIAVLAAPSGEALVHLGITRVLVMVIPLAILTALGAAALLDWAKEHWKKTYLQPLLSIAVFGLLAGANLLILRDALINGPLWYPDYGLTGQQYGAQQIFAEIKRYLKEEPDTHIVLSPSWANGTDVIARFFFNDPLPFEMGSIVGYFDEIKPLDDHTLFIMIPEEYDKIPETRFKDVRVENILDYPDGRPGFYFVRLRYVDNIQQIMKTEETQRRELITDTVTIDDQPVTVHYTAVDMGDLPDLFDGDPDTLIRSWAINPMQIHFDFPTPKQVRKLVLHIGGTASQIHIQAWQAGQESPLEKSIDLPEAPRPRDASFDFEAPIHITRLWIDIKNTNDPPNGHVHLWDITFKQ